MSPKAAITGTGKWVLTLLPAARGAAALTVAGQTRGSGTGGGPDPGSRNKAHRGAARVARRRRLSGAPGGNGPTGGRNCGPRAVRRRGRQSRVPGRRRTRG